VRSWLHKLHLILDLLYITVRRREGVFIEHTKQKQRGGIYADF
jgi:hypothetical protein